MAGHYNTRKTHCAKGHEYTEANTRITPQGYRKCRACAAETSRRKYAEDPSFRARKNGWAAKNPDKVRDKHLRRKYGLTLAEYNERGEALGWRCQICDRQCQPVPLERGRGWQRLCLVVDHDHATGRVRGLICDPCNKALGAVEDSRQTLRAMIEYLAVA